MRIYPPVFHFALAYTKACPACGAPVGRHCISDTGRINTKTHVARSKEVEKHDPLPDLSGWWKEMAPYEGKNALARPDWLVVP